MKFVMPDGVSKNPNFIAGRFPCRRMLGVCNVCPPCPLSEDYQGGGEDFLLMTMVRKQGIKILICKTIHQAYLDYKMYHKFTFTAFPYKNGMIYVNVNADKHTISFSNFINDDIECNLTEQTYEQGVDTFIKNINNLLVK